VADDRCHGKTRGSGQINQKKASCSDRGGKNTTWPSRGLEGKLGRRGRCGPKSRWETSEEEKRNTQKVYIGLSERDVIYCPRRGRESQLAGDRPGSEKVRASAKKGRDRAAQEGEGATSDRGHRCRGEREGKTGKSRLKVGGGKGEPTCGLSQKKNASKGHPDHKKKLDCGRGGGGYPPNQKNPRGGGRRLSKKHTVAAGRERVFKHRQATRP